MAYNRQIVKEVVLDREAILQFLGAEPRSSGDIAARFGVTRQAVHFHMRKLHRDGLVRLLGKGRGAKWERNFSVRLKWALNDAVPGEHIMWREMREALGDALATLSKPTRSCLDYGVTEMLNNAIDHSRGSVVELACLVDEKTIEAVVADDGVGALQNVRKTFDLPTDLDAIAHIAKGQQTTAPDRHSGQGLFFTSKLFGFFELDSGTQSWKVDNLVDDATVAPGSGRPGTQVRLRIAKNQTRRPKDVFDWFADLDSYDIDKTRIRVSLTDHGTGFISRSEAKR